MSFFMCEHLSFERLVWQQYEIRYRLSEAINIINSSNFGGVDTIRKLAEYSANVIAKNKIKVCFNLDSKINKKYITSKRVLNSDKFYRLGFVPKITIEQSMKELVAYLIEEGV